VKPGDKPVGTRVVEAARGFAAVYPVAFTLLILFTVMFWRK